MPEPRWPECHLCGKTGAPGVVCNRDYCPFTRRVNEDNDLVISITGSAVIDKDVREAEHGQQDG